MAKLLATGAINVFKNAGVLTSDQARAATDFVTASVMIQGALMDAICGNVGSALAAVAGAVVSCAVGCPNKVWCPNAKIQIGAGVRDAVLLQVADSFGAEIAQLGANATVDERVKAAQADAKAWFMTKLSN